MKNLLFITSLTLPIGTFAQNMQQQAVNYYDQINDNNNIIQMNNPGNYNPPAQVQQQTTQGSFFGSENNNEKPCNDCDEIKQAIKASHASSGGSYHRKSFSMKKWSRTFSGKMHMKMKRAFAKKYKVKTSYSFCFNWH